MSLSIYLGIANVLIIGLFALGIVHIKGLPSHRYSKFHDVTLSMLMTSMVAQGAGYVVYSVIQLLGWIFI